MADQVQQPSFTPDDSEITFVDNNVSPILAIANPTQDQLPAILQNLPVATEVVPNIVPSYAIETIIYPLPNNPTAQQYADTLREIDRELFDLRGLRAVSALQGNERSFTEYNRTIRDLKQRKTQIKNEFRERYPNVATRTIQNIRSMFRPRNYT